MSKTSQDNIQSFFQLGGIHGLPYITWDGARGDQSDSQWGGYCTHGSVLFPTWHRPYVMLYEQILQKLAVQIAATYTVDPDSWKQAANDLRQPFWDWASNAIPPDEVIALPQVTITAPDGSRILTDNPLYQYTFHPIDQSFQDPYSSWPTTLRQPDGTDSDATDDVDRLRSVLSSAQSNITTSTYNLLTRVNTWPAFSNHSVDDGGSASNSLEGIHDGIHVDVGGNGHMSDPAVAAFDPIFFLHHANVDRLLSLWAALNQGVWVSPGTAEDGTFTLPAGKSVDVNTGLTPFWNHQTTFWPSTAVQDTTRLGYSYPEFNGVDMGNPDAVRTAIGNFVNQAYGSSVFGSFAAVFPSFLRGVTSTADNKKAATPKEPASSIPVHDSSHGPVVIKPPQPASSIPFHDNSHGPVVINPPQPAPSIPFHDSSHGPVVIPQHSASSTQVTDNSKGHANTQNPPAPRHPVSAIPGGHGPVVIHPHPTPAPPVAAGHPDRPPNRGLWEWTARIEFKKYELGTSFSVLIFLGEVPEDPQQWRISQNYVGGTHAFVNSAAGSCANCTNQREMVQEGFVHLNHAIAKLSGLGSLEPHVIEPYLTEALQWKVQQSNGDVAELESLEVTVIATPLTYPLGAMFPVPGHAVRYHRITHGRPGGSRHHA
jgi:tyrosinase